MYIDTYNQTCKKYLKVELKLIDLGTHATLTTTITTTTTTTTKMMTIATTTTTTTTTTKNYDYNNITTTTTTTTIRPTSTCWWAASPVSQDPAGANCFVAVDGVTLLAGVHSNLTQKWSISPTFYKQFSQK